MLMNRAEMTATILARLDADAELIRKDWNKVSPGTKTRYCTVDNLLPETVATEIRQAFPKDADGFSTRASFREHKRTSGNFDELPRILADITFAMQSPAVVDKIADLTGMPNLEPDPHLYAGGLSMMFLGEFLNPHIDNSHEATKAKYRRINLLYYVAPDWAEENGGNLELWDDNVTKPVTIVSDFNRLVLMETNNESWHSVSPLNVDGPRCCVSNYYFSEASPSGKDYYHVTSFTGRPEQKVRRALGLVDNAARRLARSVGAKRSTDKGYEGSLGQED
ncbi:2OG-Fe(II) oxygenase [Sphingomonas sp. 22R3R2A-7]|uniref:2OG-Fe(II) oxygenase n=1 Tax=Sphingomonas sp. 22R3R2A-7 TaxID=3050230 RepID=UPI002FE3A2F4